jgi:hypothetical protein
MESMYLNYSGVPKISIYARQSYGVASRTAMSAVAFSRPSCRTDKMIPEVELIAHMMIDDIPINREAAGVYDSRMFDLSKQGVEVCRDSKTEELTPREEGTTG